MAYRDETEALRARVEELETENASLREQLAVASATPDDVKNETARRWLGGPVLIEIDRSFQGTLSREAHEPIVELLQERFGAMGTASVIGNTLTWRQGPYNGQRVLEVTISSRRGQTRVHMLERLGSVAGGLFGGIVGGVGGGGMGLVIPLAMLVSPALALGLAPLWLVFIYGIVRAGFGAMARRHEAEVHAAGTALVKIVEAELVPEPPRVRVDVPADESSELDPHEADAQKTQRASR
ncbi:MAG: hypothetical protein K1X94_02080 [Sandaracinaceae bacterium]|nr:hypothetical protein [Sandaracinaceae bacterium]